MATLISLAAFSMQGQNIIFQENFDTTQSGQLPPGWNLFHLVDSAAVNWRTSFSPVNSTKGMRHGPFGQFQNIDTVDNYSVSPPIILTQNNILTFSERVWKYISTSSLADAEAGIYLSTTGGDPRINTFNKIHDFDTTQLGIAQNFSVNLSQYAGDTIYLGFRYYALPLTYNYAVDDIVISEPGTDGGLTHVVSPSGTVFPGSVQNVVVEVKNFQNSTIDSITINWDVNGTAQPAYTNSALGLGAGDSIQVTVGSFNFTTGINTITAVAAIPSDNNAANDTATGIYTVSPTIDLSMEDLAPKGAFPISGVQQVSAKIKNNGTVTTNSCNINWWVDGTAQIPYQGNFLNILPGDSLTIVLGTANYTVGSHITAATITNANDINPSNDSLGVSVVIGQLFEDFEGEFLPEGWTSHYGLRDNILSPIQNWYYEAQAASNVFGTVTDTLFTPYLDIDTGNTISFQLRMNAFYPTTAFMLAKDLNTGAITYLDTITSTALGWVSRSVNLTPAVGIQRVGFCFVSSSLAGGGSIDLVQSTAVRYLQTNDLKVQKPTFENVARINIPHAIEVGVKNVSDGAITGSAYTVKLYDGATVLSTLNGLTLQPWQEETFTFSPSFTSIAKNSLHVEVDYAQDPNQSNNTSAVFDVYAVPQNSIDKENGQPTFTTPSLPFNGNGSDFTLGSEDLSQVIYVANDLKAGFIYGYELKARNLIEGERKLPVQIWIGETSNNNLSAGWESYANLTLVFDDTIVVSGLEQNIYIPFSSPYLYSGTNNVVIQSYQYDPEWPSLATSFYASSVNQMRARQILDVFTIDPTSPMGGGTQNNIPFTSFVIDTLTDLTNVVGTVTDASTQLPLNTATVEIANFNFLSTTNAQGVYGINSIPYGNYQFEASKFGYYDSVSTVVLNSAEDTVDFVLTPRPNVQLEFYVTGSDAPNVPIDAADAELSVYGQYTSASNSAGYVLFNPIFGDADYVLTVRKKGYLDYVMPILVPASNVNLDTIVLQQEVRSAYNVIAQDAGNGQDAIITWQPPLFGADFQQKLDLGMVSFSLTNEPNENVWLGNYFPNTDTVTITSAEVYFDYYPNAHDFVTIEVFNADEEFLVSSTPFQTYHDSTFLIDIPNVTVIGDYYVMLHWQNNPLSTDALAIDFSQGLANFARIKYPNQSIDTLGAYVPGIPHGAFLLRANYINDENPQLPVNVTYNISRGLLSDYANAATWPLLNMSALSSTTFTDNSWSQVGTSDIYTYAIETQYGSGNAERTLSTVVDSKFIGVHEDLVEQSIIAYPNPVTDVVRIDNMVVGSTNTLVDQLGRVIMTFEARNTSITLDLSQLAHGLYILNNTVNNKTTTLKLIVQ